MDIRPPHQWIEPQPVTIPPEIAKRLGENSLVAYALALRAIQTWEQAQAFLDPRHYQPTPASELPDLMKGAERVLLAMRNKERIGIWGDFDVDGQTSTTLLVDTLRELGAEVLYHIPVRAQESHGVNLPNLEKMIAQGAKVIVTCDTGITAHDAAEFARAKGVDFIITDHHTLPEILPDAFAVINPQRLPNGHPLKTLPGVGTAYKFAEALYSLAGKPEQAQRHLDLVALGTVADLAVLTGDARYLVQLGLEQLRAPVRLGIKVMLELTETNPDHLSEEHIGFILAPRLNAIGRLGDANPMVEFLTTQDRQKAATYANQLEGLNGERKVLTDQVFQGAQAQIRQDPSLLKDSILVLAHPQWPGGVVGIVASRLVELYHKPAILLTAPAGEAARGSARSIEGINITEAIAAQSSLLLGYGGHPMAAGLAIKPENLPAFRRKINETVSQQMAGKELTAEIQIDAYLDLDQVNLELVEKIDTLAPFGPGNPPLTFAVRNLSMTSAVPIGKSGEHLQVIVEDHNGQTRKIIWWQGADSPLPEGRFDLACTIRASNFRGQREIQMEWLSYRQLEEAAKTAKFNREKIEVFDFRNNADAESILYQAMQNEPVEIWQEGEAISGLPGHARARLQPAPTLAIWTIPPGRRELEDAIQQVQPKRIMIFAHHPGSDEPQAFLVRLAGLIRHAVTTYQGKINLQDLCAATGQREITLITGIRWLAAKGYIRIENQSDHLFQVAEGGVPDTALRTAIEKDLLVLLQETAAFRGYYLRASTDSLINH